MDAPALLAATLALCASPMAEQPTSIADVERIASYGAMYGDQPSRDLALDAAMMSGPRPRDINASPHAAG